ncbi:MAG: hypothetical protein WDZ28_05345 [Simkaniaceae bacterium]
MIKIANRFRPYSHEPGCRALIPGSTHHVQAFPTLIRLFFDRTLLFEKSLPFTGPIKNFTLTQDLEKGILRLFGHAKEGYFVYKIYRLSDKILIHSKQEIDSIPITDRSFVKKPLERLSLGVHKAQEFEKIVKRASLNEWLPILFHLGQWMPTLHFPETLLRRLQSPSDWPELFRGCFRSLFMPTLFDDHYLNIPQLNEMPPLDSPLSLITALHAQIRSLFIQPKKDHLNLLPSLSREIRSGRMIDVEGEGYRVDFEWTKGKLRRVFIKPFCDREVGFSLPRELKSFRMNKERVLKRGERLFLKKNQLIFLDQFEK